VRVPYNLQLRKEKRDTEQRKSPFMCQFESSDIHSIVNQRQHNVVLVLCAFLAFLFLFSLFAFIAID